MLSNSWDNDLPRHLHRATGYRTDFQAIQGILAKLMPSSSPESIEASVDALRCRMLHYPFPSNAPISFEGETMTPLDHLKRLISKPPAPPKGKAGKGGLGQKRRFFAAETEEVATNKRRAAAPRGLLVRIPSPECSQDTQFGGRREADAVDPALAPTPLPALPMPTLPTLEVSPGRVWQAARQAELSDPCFPF